MEGGGFPDDSNGKESACNAGDLGLIPESGRSPGEGNGNPLQHSCVEDPMDRGAWWATVHSVAESDTTKILMHTHIHQVEDGMMMLIFLTSINKSLNSVDPSFLLNSLLLKPFLEHACTPSLKFPNFAIRGDTALGKGL